MSGTPLLRLGIDVGGTNTDAVLLDADGSVLASAKVATSKNISSGVSAAVAAVFADGAHQPAEVGYAMLGTTHATNAILQRQNLDTVAVVRIGSPAGHGIPPLFGWPDDLRAAVSVGETIVPGGFEFDGREIVAFEPDAVRSFLAALPDRPDGLAIVGIFAPTKADHELAAADVARELLGDIDISLSSEIGGIGLIERENATVLNATLKAAAREALLGFEKALRGHGMNPKLLFAQNDGTLMSIDQALRTPVLTIGSGPSNSIRGAAQLAGATSGIVADVGGTTTDIGVLVNGLPRESYVGRMIGGVRTNFRMPDIVTVAIGGGTIIRSVDGHLRLGPDSVGWRLREKALVFGGDTPTLTDAAVHAGRLSLGDASRLAGYESLLEEAIAESDRMLAFAVDQAKISRENAPLIVVGGGRALVPTELPGVDILPSPLHFDVANAIGAASAAIGAEAESVIPLDGQRSERVAELHREALDRAVAAGAHPGSVEIVSIEETPLAYLSPPAVRYRIRAAGSIGSL
ncbi:hydantoinase/oxoprolinase family protein [Herbiconiux sp. CPCC 203407]|uniref:Hydantoinase/oxoprolinase family protein n=1 Tax=Herbiconiux oxytropis TaxID=2970915 RepID=A0AA42BVI1_9MICO|nr:hydantoinase/oxoprolinase family protein [Herbiconiux oxytropis]MCS5722544.1 hydantoinase/oxoprolinase family protein [Herbiconiux oxytropis]MCS5726484.1 hydantoinase/oxoprolinase family protein [Herbiconiux oxytropis]